MDRTVAIEQLNSLFAAERAGILSYLLHSTSFISWATAEEEQELRRMVRENDEHVSWLAEAITALHGGVAPSVRNLRCAELNYQDLRFLLPRMLEDEERLVARCEATLAGVSSEPRAAATVSRILQRHREHVGQMSRFLARSRGLAPASA